MALTAADMRSASNGGSSDAAMLTPVKSHFPLQATPKRSERKRALFPTTSPQTSDLGHISPLGSSPDRYSSAPASPDSQNFSPIKPRSGPVSPFGRKPGQGVSQHISPRRRFSELFGCNVGVLTGQRSIASSSNVQQTQPCPLGRSSEIVPADQLEQTVLSAMEDSDIADSPLSHVSQHTPSTTPKRAAHLEVVSEKNSIHPLTPSKRRSKFVPISGSGSTTSTSPQSPKRQRRLSLENKSKSAELPRARLSLFSEIPYVRREKDDGIYLTGRSSKSRKTFGQINAGVRTGIRLPPKAKPKKEQPSKKQRGKVQSLKDVAPKASRKRKASPIKLPKMSLAPKQVKLSNNELAEVSASASLHMRTKECTPIDQDKDEKLESMEEEKTESASKNRIFKTKSSKKRVATINLNKNVRITLTNGKFTVTKPASTPTPKRRRKLFDREKQIEAINTLEKQIEPVNTFDDNQEDVADGTRKDVMVILEKLSDENRSEAKVESFVTPLGHVVESSSQEESSQNSNKTNDNPLSPLSELASSTSTLSLNIGRDILHLKESQVQALSQVPDLIMEEDDICVSAAHPSKELKENNGSVANIPILSPEKYFPIFSCKSKDKGSPKRNSLCIPKRQHHHPRPIGEDQYQIDAGQKKFGATQCSECNTIYHKGDPEDEILHNEIHNSLKFLKHAGWKYEKVVGEFGSDRVIVVKPGDSKSWWTKVLSVLEIVDRHLGYASVCLDDIPNHSMTFLYVTGKHIVGCLVAQHVKTAYRLLLSESETGGIDFCSKEEFPVKCGVSRIWVHPDFHRRHFASKLMDCLRKNFLIDEVLSLEDIAFSSPTMLGKLFAEKYIGRKDFFVYV